MKLQILSGLILFNLISVYTFGNEESCLLEVFNDTTEKFRYRDILEDYIDTLPVQKVENLFGNWIISSIAKTGGTFQSEQKIQSQIGKRIHFNSSEFIFPFLDKKKTFKNPFYKINYLDTRQETELKTTTYYYGYRSCRKRVIMLDISAAVHFEVINYNELAYFYEGRIYFLKRDGSS